VTENAKNPIQELLEKERTNAEEIQRKLSDSEVRISAFQQSLTALNGSSTPEVQRMINERIRKEQESIKEAKAQIREVLVRIEVFKETLKAASGNTTGGTRDLRPGALAQIRDILRKEGRNLPLNEILKALGRESDSDLRTFRGTLSQYAKKGRVFTKDEITGTYGLIEFQDAKPKE